MSDISLHITWLDIAILAPLIGWPGLLIGGALGAFAWKKRRIVGAILGGVIGSIVWAFARILLK